MKKKKIIEEEEEKEEEIWKWTNIFIIYCQRYDEERNCWVNYSCISDPILTSLENTEIFKLLERIFEKNRREETNFIELTDAPAESLNNFAVFNFQKAYDILIDVDIKSFNLNDFEVYKVILSFFNILNIEQIYYDYIFRLVIYSN